MFELFSLTILFRLQTLKDLDPYIKTKEIRNIEQDVEMIEKRDLDFAQILSKHLKPDTIAYDFEILMKLMGFVIKKIKIPNYFKGKITDSIVQEIFKHVKGEDGVNYFYVLVFMPRPILSDFRKVIIDDKVMILIMERLFNEFDVHRYQEHRLISHNQYFHFPKDEGLSNFCKVVKYATITLRCMLWREPY